MVHVERLVFILVMHCVIICFYKKILKNKWIFCNLIISPITFWYCGHSYSCENNYLFQLRTFKNNYLFQLRTFKNNYLFQLRTFKNNYLFQLRTWSSLFKITWKNLNPIKELFSNCHKQFLENFYSIDDSLLSYKMR